MKSLVIILIGLAGLGWVNYSLMFTPVETAPIMAVERNRPLLTSIDAADNADREIGDIVQSYARPLFSPTRRPFVPEVEVEETVEAAQPIVEAPVIEPAVAVSEPQLIIKGIQAGPAGAKALVQNLETGKTDWIETESLIGAWIVTKIEAEAITLSYADREIRRSLFPDQQSKAQSN